MTLATGSFLGHYEITGSLGAGGMGEVYRAKDTKLGRDVAIKTLPSAFAKDHDRVARFEREAKLLAALNHAHIAAIYGLDEQGGTQYLAMELVDGETLEEKLKSGPLRAEDALQLALQIAEALEAAHEKGVVHRDLKPANIMVTREGQVKVLDFGLAKAFSDDPNETSPAHSPALSPAMTQQGLILGTAGYMSPEQASGQPADQRADVWAFGVVLFEMLTGLPLFAGESVPHILAAILQTEPDWSRLPKALHPRLKRLLERCLEKKVRNRYHGIADARVDIEQVLSDPRGVTPATSIGQSASRRTLAVVAAAAAIATAALAGLAAWSLWPAVQPRPVNRFSDVLPADQTLRNTGRSVIALSPDGRRLVYNTTRGLYMRSMSDLEAQLIPGTEESLASPFFAPDGQTIGYWTLAGQLKRIPLSGGTPPSVIAAVSAPLNGGSWRSGRTVIYGGPKGVFRVSADDGNPELVIPAEAGEQVYGPELLPDGDSVVFSSTKTGDWDRAQIVVQSLSTGKRTVLIDGGSEADYVPGGYLVYARGDRLLAVAFDAGRLTVSGEPVPLVSGVMRAASGATGAADYSVSNDGTLVYVSGNAGGGSTLVWVDRAGHEEPLGLEQCLCYFGGLSPDGTRLTLNQVSGGTADVWVWSLAQQTFTRLTRGPGLKRSPLWTPDGKRIVYQSPEGFFWLPSDGTGTAEQLIAGEGLEPFGWTPDGALLFTDSSRGNFDIGELAITGDSKPRFVLTEKFNEGRPALSPDGRWLAYESDESGQYEIYVRPFPDVEKGKVQVSEGGGQEPRWSRDGGTLFFLGPKNMIAAEVDTTSRFTFRPPKAMFDRARYYFPGAARQYDVSPDGQRLLVAKGGPAGKIIIVTDWTQELKRLVPTNGR